MSPRLLLCLGALSCAGPGARVVAPAPASGMTGGERECALVSAPGPVPDTVSIALTGVVNRSHAPTPRDAAERFAFRQLFETLIRVDCLGRVEPGLAGSWRSGESGRVWVFTLRPDARFQDGVPVTASDVVTGWTSRPTGPPAGMSAEALSDRELAIRLPRGTAEVPRMLADPTWAVTKPGAGHDWPVGTGRYRADTTGAHFILDPLVGKGPVVELRSRVAGDMRDLLDAGVDLLVTAEPAALNYAASRGDLTTLPLPWDSTYVLLGQGAISLTDSVRVGLARDAVRVDARPAAGPFWWLDLDACALGPPASGSVPFQPAEPVWLTARGDDPARDLAGRLIALGRTGPDTMVRAMTLTPDAFTTALRMGRAAGFIFAIARQPLDRCTALRALVGHAPWIQGAVVVPLIDTRRHVVVRRGAGAFTVDWDGTLRLR